MTGIPATTPSARATTTDRRSLVRRDRRHRRHVDPSRAAEVLVEGAGDDPGRLGRSGSPGRSPSSLPLRRRRAAAGSAGRSAHEHRPVRGAGQHLVHEPPLVVTVGEVAAQVTAAGLLAAVGGIREGLAEVEEVRRLPGARARLGLARVAARRAPRGRPAPSASTRPTADRPGPGGHRPLHLEPVAAVELVGLARGRRTASRSGSSPASTRAVMSSAIRWAKTRPSRREFEASRFAPWTPGARALPAGVEAGQRGAADAGRSRPRPRRSAGPGRPAAGRSPGRSPSSRQRVTIDGKRSLEELPAQVARVEQDVVGAAVAAIRARIARATTSRGARSASGWTPCMKRSPSRSTRKAPSPRTASEMSGC